MNTVNTVGVMGRGLALQFKKAYPKNFKEYAAACKRGEVAIGKMFITEVGGITLPRYVINFPTKKHWRSKSRIEYVEAGLEDLIRVVHELKIKSLAVPPLGAGLGGLPWPTVFQRIETALGDLPEVEIVVYEPRGSPDAGKMANRTRKPAMTPGRAIILALMNRYLVPGYMYRLSLLEVQKLAYFAQTAGASLRLKYESHIYGPYADTLRHALNNIEGHYIEGVGDGRTSPETEVRLLPGAANDAEQFLNEDGQTQAYLERVATLIEGFETPFGMELLATVHWAAANNVDDPERLEDVVTAVQGWSSRKKRLMRREHVVSAWRQLRDHGWLEAPTSD